MCIQLATGQHRQHFLFVACAGHPSIRRVFVRFPKSTCCCPAQQRQPLSEKHLAENFSRRKKEMIFRLLFFAAAAALYHHRRLGPSSIYHYFISGIIGHHQHRIDTRALAQSALRTLKSDDWVCVRTCINLMECRNKSSTLFFSFDLFGLCAFFSSFFFALSELAWLPAPAMMCAVKFSAFPTKNSLIFLMN